MVRVIVAFLFLAMATVARADPPPQDPYGPGRALVADIDRIVTPNGVDETLTVDLGGARQVVNVRGADRRNPILIFVHGGPGSVEMPNAWAFQRPWEDYFTVVEWDQRGAGLSYKIEDAKVVGATLKVDRYRDDAIQLIELLRKRYGKRKVFLLGHSWGSIVGLSVAERRPDLLYAYIGMGQVIDFPANERVGFEWTLAQARAAHDDQAVRELEALRPYPGSGRFDLDKVSTERKWEVHFGALAAGRSDGDFYFHAWRLSPLYGPGDGKAIDAGSELSMTHLFPTLSDVSFEKVHRLDTPVFLFMGRGDYTTPAPVAADWFARLSAPRKSLVWFDHSAHLPMIEEPGRVLIALVEKVRPLAGGDLPTH